MAGGLAWVSARVVYKMALGFAPSWGSQKDVARFAIRTDQSLLLQGNSHQTKKPERFVPCGGLLREASPSSVYEGLPTWSLIAANAPKNLLCVTAGIRSAIPSQPTRRCWNWNPGVARGG